MKFMRQIVSLIIFIFGFLPHAFASMNLVLIGPPGGGKGTVAHELQVKYGIPHISTGDLVRKEIRDKTPFGLKVEALVQSGQLLPDTPEFMGELVRLVKHRLQEPDCQTGFILDGMPRRLVQAVELDKVLDELQIGLDAIVVLDVPNDVLIERLGGRLTCSSCGRTFHKTLRPPKVEGTCDDCCSPLLTRADDNEESVRRRLEIYEREFAPILAHYSPRPEFLRLDGQVGAARLADQISDFVQGPYPRTYLQQRIATHPHPDHPAIAMYNLIEMYKDVGFIRYVISQFAASVHELRPDYIAAPEARALPIFGALIHETGRPGIFIRKAGKLPATAPKLSESYTTAYSEEKIEMNVDPNLQGKTVMIVDDGISSGGTTLATVRLLEQAGMKVIAVRAVIQYHYRELEPDFVSSGILEMTETLQDLK